MDYEEQELAKIEVRTPDGKTVIAQITVMEFDHINLKEYLTDVYMAVCQSAQVANLTY